MAPSATLNSIATHESGLKKLKLIGTLQHFPRVYDTEDLQLSVLAFCNASLTSGNYQLAYIVGLLLDDFGIDFIYHFIAWCSHKAKRPVRSIEGTEILGVGEAIDEGKLLARVLSSAYKRKITLAVSFYSKDIFTALSTQQSSLGRSIRSDVNIIGFA